MWLKNKKLMLLLCFTCDWADEILCHAQGCILINEVGKLWGCYLGVAIDQFGL